MLTLKTIPKICRLCLGNDPEKLMAAVDILDASLTIEMVELFTGVQLNTANNMSCSICVECKHLLTQWFEFRCACLSNDILFKQAYATYTVPSNDKTDEKEVQPQRYDTNLFQVEIMLPHEEIEDDYNMKPTAHDVLAIDNEPEYVEEILFEETLAEDKQQDIPVPLTASSDPSCSDLYETSSNSMAKDSQQVLLKREKSSTDRKQQLCVTCGKLVKNLWYHLRTHAEETTTYACPQCPMKMKDQSNLARHIQAVHMKKVVISCEPCGRGFSHINSYKAHMRSRHGIGETYQCQICLKTFKQPSGYKKHTSQAHNNERNFVCSVCDKPFKDRQALNLHKNVHSTERRYACSLCPKQFKGASAKRTHELTHVGVVFKCTSCDKAYQYKSLLNLHVKKNHPERDETSSKE